MKQVVIEIDKKGNYRILKSAKKVEVVIKTPKPKTLKKRYRTLVFKVKSLIGIQ